MKRLFFISIILALIPVATNAASLTPGVMEMTAARAEVIKQTLTVINAKAIDQTYFLGVMKFEPSDEGGIPKFIPFEEDHTGLPEWIQFPFSEFIVKANSKQDVKFNISIPADAISGGYYAAVTVSEAPSDLVADNGAIVEAKTAALVLLTVAGETEEKLALLDFKTSVGVKSNVEGPFEYRVQNQGNVHTRPSGDVLIKDIFGRTVAIFDANSTFGRVLPNSTRQFVVGPTETESNLYEVLKHQMRIFAIGPMTAELLLTYGNSGNVISSQIGFWYLPWQIMLTDVVLIVLIILLYKLARGHKSTQTSQ